MSKQQGTVVIPKVDGHHGIRFTSEAVTDIANQVNGARALKSILEHDPHYLPLGKISEVSIEDRNEEIVLTTTIDDTHSIGHFDHQQTGAPMIEMTFANDTRPFVRHSFSDEPSTLHTKADRANFEDWDKYEQFAKEAQDSISHA